MQFANTVNDLVVKFMRLNYDETLQADMLVMERIYPIDFRAYEVEKRALWMDVLTSEITQLHQAGFVHRAIRRPSDISGQPFDNVLLTNNGISFIDVGISAMQSKVANMLFNKYIEIEQKELAEFKNYFLNR